MTEHTEVLILGSLWAIFAEVTDNAHASTVAWVLAYAALACVAYMTWVDVRLLWRRNRRRREPR